MNRLEILLLDRKNGVICNEYVDTTSLLNFLHRSGNIHRYQVVARKGKKAIYIDRIDPTTIGKELTEFQNQQ